MKIGSKELVYSQVFLIPAGDVVTEVVKFGETSVSFTFAVDKPTDERKNGTLWWECDAIKGVGELIFYGDVPGIAASTPILELGIIDGALCSIAAVYFGNSHVCSMHVQIMREA